MVDKRTLRNEPRPGIGGRPPLAKGEKTKRVQCRVPESEYEEFRLLSADLNESQALLRAIRFWIAVAKQRNGEATE